MPPFSVVYLTQSDESKDPTFWSRVCLHNMAQLAKEATTVRRVLESLFRYFDDNDLWSPQHGLALTVLLDMQSIIEKSGIPSNISEQEFSFCVSICLLKLKKKLINL